MSDWPWFKPDRMLFILNSLVIMGGVEHRTLAQIQYLRDRGQVVEVCVLRAVNETSSRYLRQGISVHFIAAYDFRGRWRLLRSLVGVLRLWWFLLRGRYGIIVCATHPSHYIGRLASLPRMGRRVFAMERGNTTLRKKKYFFWDRFCAHWTEAVLCNSCVVRDGLLVYSGVPSEKLVVIEDGFPRPPQKAVNDLRDLRKRLDGYFVIGCMAMLVESKRQEILLRAVHKALPQLGRVAVVLAGGGPEFQRLIQLCRQLDLASLVLFLGHVSNPHDYYPLFNLFALPSISEGLPGALVEAWLQSLPVLCANVRPMNDYVHHLENGVLFQADNVEDLARWLVCLRRDDALRQRLGSAGRTTAAQSFDFERQQERRWLLFRDGLSRPARGTGWFDQQRVLVIMNSLLIMAGIERRTLEQLQYLRSRGLSLEVCVLREMNETAEVFRKQGFPVRFIRAYRRLASGRLIPCPFGFVRLYVHMLISRCGTILCTHHPSHYIGRFACLPRLGRRIFVWERVNLQERKKKYLFLDRFCARWTDVIVCNSPLVRDALRDNAHIPESRLRVIEEGFRRQPPHTDRARLRNDLAGKFIVGCMAMLLPGKRQCLLLRALKLALPDLSPTCLVLAGGGPDEGRIRDLVRQLGLTPYVLMPGHVEYPHDYYPLFDIFAFPSISEGFPGVVVEAWLHGLPVLCADVRPMNDYVRHLENGVLFRADDVDDHARWLVELKRNSDLRNRVGMAGKKTAEKKFNYEQQQDCQYKLLFSTASEKRKSS